MNIPKLIWSEIRYRKLGFAIALLAVIVAVASSVGVVTIIRSAELNTEKRVAALDDEIRKITKNMGFNITILPRDQNLLDFHANDFGAKTMPFEFVERLAESPDVVTVNHLRPGLIQKIDWQEQDRQILLMGVTGIVPFAHRDPKKPLTEPVPPGTANVGSILAAELGIEPNGDMVINGHQFKVGKIYPPRGSKDDITVWVDLGAAQQMLDLAGQINIIQALECNCATIDRLGEIRAEITKLLGNEVQVIELATKAIARAEARNHVKSSGTMTIAGMRRTAMVLLPTAIIGACLLVGFITLANARERQAEIGILRAIGTSSKGILLLFLGKAVVAGCVGAAIGYGIGFFAIVWRNQWAGEPQWDIPINSLFQVEVLVAALVLTPLVTILASWIPSLVAASKDPAVVLRED